MKRIEKVELDGWCYRWMRYFPLSQIHIVDGDRWISRPIFGHHGCIPHDKVPDRDNDKDKDKELFNIFAIITDVFLTIRFIKEPWVGLKQLEEFLEIPSEITEENFFFNATKVDLVNDWPPR